MHLLSAPWLLRNDSGFCFLSPPLFCFPCVFVSRLSVLELKRMVKSATGKSALLSYSWYGCFCGIGGRGTPVDATDRCCQRHDACYDGLLRHRCDAKRERYRYGWHGGGPVCYQGSWCAQLSCECDRSLALCLRRSLGTYRARYRFYPKHACRR
uniref:Phospholipase A2 n=1 Tax=Apteryx owenii TaxID=8824 RepID=A0A8B9PWP8_APTOW